ncbi:hypothetical protein QE197_00475 [Arsenophonus nasoniae]|uniref:Uncharacterized protein n=1 Tax=Arsenophonus nasoniae TaxID=638 RepID=A0A4P7KQ75_9GAMM|nr:hypothetical protein [Arsenophonus nasoniae]QBY41716.1 hypothetical protein ArsFIN_02440 [Arsenophonus nasoniae]WGM05901.1 hypothetical protein QE258_00470 [Arsenophonus nasoniae]WGM10914.1 hypothetical protein QE197_00475 [Arsenophonus nasoniae]WGM15619.1 hypothetical protein QE193_00460 [Arsenophonus nasoniae]
MNRTDNNQIEILFVVLGFLLLIGFAVWIKKIFEIPLDIAINTGIKIVIWIALISFIIWYFRSNFNVIKLTTPLMLSLLWCSFFPILDYKAGIRDNFPIKIEPEWYGTAFWQFIIFLAINGIGYGIIYYQNKRNNDYY